MLDTLSIHWVRSVRYHILATSWDRSSPEMSTVGKVEEFDGTKEEWPQYVERLGHFFDANGINTAERKRSVLHWTGDIQGPEKPNVS